MKREFANTGTLAAIAAAVAIDGNAKRIQLFPFGTWTGKNGQGPYTLVDRNHAQRVIDVTKASTASADINIDYDHQVALSAVPGVGGTAPASGWIKPDTLTVEDDGIWAEPEWTAKASAAIAAREYRYVSPFFLHDKQGRITRILNVGLVNIPNFDLPAVASALGMTGEVSSMDKALLEALGLSDGASAKDAIAAITALKKNASHTAIASALGLGEDADTAAIASAIGTLKDKVKAGETVDPTMFVPADVADELRSELAGLRQERLEAAIASAIEDGKLTPAEKPWALQTFAGNPAAFASMVAVRPTFMEPGKRKQTEGEPKPGEIVLSEEDKAIASIMGVSEEEMIAARKVEMEGRN